MPYSIEPDDAVHRYEDVFLGPDGATPKTLPWHARTKAYVIFGVLFAAVMGIEALTASIPMPPWREAVFCSIASGFIMLAVDHDKPIQAVIRNVMNLALVAQHRSTRTVTARPALRRTKITRKPL